MRAYAQHETGVLFVHLGGGLTVAADLAMRQWAPVTDPDPILGYPGWTPLTARDNDALLPGLRSLLDDRSCRGHLYFHLGPRIGKDGKERWAARGTSSESTAAKNKRSATPEGKASAAFDKAKAEGDEEGKLTHTQAIAESLGQAYRAGGEGLSGIAAQVIGGAGVGAIAKAVRTKAATVYKNDPKLLRERKRAAEFVAKAALMDGNAKRIASSMLIADLYRKLADEADASALKRATKAAPATTYKTDPQRKGRSGFAG